MGKLSAEMIKYWMANVILSEELRARMAGGPIGAMLTQGRTVKMYRRVGHFKHVEKVGRKRISTEFCSSNYTRLPKRTFHIQPNK